MIIIFITLFTFIIFKNKITFKKIMESSTSFNSEFPKLSPQEYIEKHKIDILLSEVLNTLVSKKNKKPEAYMV